ncbi:unnamed protein product, partial [Iphiclides podalirius]
MTQDVNDIVKALTHSTFLELSEDKLKVKRKTPMLPYDADARTVYVESIPVKATQEWLERVFSDYGRVAYISLPKFKNSQKLKGFGFIEFEKPQEAQKCINAFSKMGCKLPTCMPPEELSSIKMFSIEDQPEEPNESKDDSEPPKKKSKKAKDKKKNLELKLDHDSDSERRVETPIEENKSIVTPTEEGKTTDAESKDEMTSQDESKNEQEPRRKKKAKKRKKKNGSKDKNKLPKSEVQNGGLWGLQVLPKNEWKALRNKYLNLQRKNLKEFKARLHNKKNVYSAIPAAAAPTLEAESGIKAQEMESSKIVIPLDRIPGVFVEEVLPEPCLDFGAHRNFPAHTPAQTFRRLSERYVERYVCAHPNVLGRRWSSLARTVNFPAHTPAHTLRRLSERYVCAHPNVLGRRWSSLARTVNFPAHTPAHMLRRLSKRYVCAHPNVLGRL